MMPSTNTRQDTTVLIYLNVSLISMFPWHGGREGVRGGGPATLPLLGFCAGAKDCDRLELELPDQEVLVGGVIISRVPRSHEVERAGGNPLSSPLTPATPQARTRAIRAHPHRLGGVSMPLASVGVR